MKASSLVFAFLAATSIPIALAHPLGFLLPLTSFGIAVAIDVLHRKKSIQ